MLENFFPINSIAWLTQNRYLRWAQVSDTYSYIHFPMPCWCSLRWQGAWITRLWQATIFKWLHKRTFTFMDNLKSPVHLMHTSLACLRIQNYLENTDSLYIEVQALNQTGLCWPLHHHAATHFIFGDSSDYTWMWLQLTSTRAVVKHL